MKFAITVLISLFFSIPVLAQSARMTDIHTEHQFSNGSYGAIDWDIEILTMDGPPHLYNFCYRKIQRALMKSLSQTTKQNDQVLRLDGEVRVNCGIRGVTYSAIPKVCWKPFEQKRCQRMEGLVF